MQLGGLILGGAGEGILKEVTFELRFEGCIGNKQRDGEKNGPGRRYHKKKPCGGGALA